MYDGPTAMAIPSGGVGRIGGGVVGVAPPMQQPNARSEIAQELETQEKGMHLLHELIASIEDKLSPVLEPSAPDTCGPINAPRGTPIGGCLAQNNARLGAAIERLRSLQSRIAL